MGARHFRHFTVFSKENSRQLQELLADPEHHRAMVAVFDGNRDHFSLYARSFENEDEDIGFFLVNTVNKSLASKWLTGSEK